MLRSGGEAASSTVPRASANGHSGTGAPSEGSETAGGAEAVVRCSSATITALRSGRPAEDGTDPLDPLGVDEGHLGARVLEPVAQLLAAPPRVQRDDDGPGQRGAPERHDPLGQVPHDDGDPVALFDPEGGAQPVGQGAGDAVVLGEGRPLVLVDEEDVVAVAERHVHHGAERRRRVLPNPRGHAADVELFHLEELPGGGEGGVGLRDRHRRRILARAAHVLSFSAWLWSWLSLSLSAARSKTAPR